MSESKWEKIYKEKQKEIENNSLLSRSLTKNQYDFCTQFVFSEVKSNSEWGKIFGVSAGTISSWLNNPKCIDFIEEVRRERKEKLSDEFIGKASIFIDSLADIVRVDHTYVVNKGTAKEAVKVDSSILDQKVRASQAFFNLIKGDGDIKNKVNIYNQNINGQKNKDSNVIDINKELEDIDNQIKEIKQLSDN